MKKSINLTLFDNPKNRYKSKSLGKLEIMADDEDNLDKHGFWESLDKAIRWGETYKLSIEKVSKNQPK